MTPPIKTQGYVQAGAWTTRRADGEQFPNAGVTLGGNLKTANGFYLNGELGAGTALRGQVKLGKDTHLGNGFGLDVSARAEYNNQFRNSDTSIMLGEIKHDYKVDIPDGKETVILANGQSETVVGPATREYTYSMEEQQLIHSYKSAEVKFAGRVEGVKKFKAGQVKLGVEAGYQKDNQVSLAAERSLFTNITVDNEEHSQYTSQKAAYIPKNSGWYVSPTISGELNLNKSNTLKLATDLSLNEATAGIRYMF